VTLKKNIEILYFYFINQTKIRKTMPQTETNKLLDITTFPFDAFSSKKLENGHLLSILFKIDPEKQIILDCRWHCEVDTEHSKIIEFLSRLVVGLSPIEIVELMPSYVENALTVLKVSHSSPIEALLSTFKSELKTKKTTPLPPVSQTS
jgi:hypothetical protein